MTRILLTGTTGQVGWELQRSLMTLGEVVAVGRSSGNLCLDLSQPDTIRHVIRTVRPQLIVNAAAYTAVDQAESEPELAIAINATAPGIMAEEAKLIGAAIVHYSTDYVFNGAQAKPYKEEDLTDPQNIYGKTKLSGEQAIQAVDLPHLILRTSWVYGLRGKNFLLTMLKLARDRQELKVVNDQIGAPTWSRLIAEATAQILAQSVKNDFSESGVYHLTSTGQTSWHDFARSIFDLDPHKQEQKLQNLMAIAASQYPTPAQRPAYSCLDTTKISRNFGLTLPDWRSNLELVLG